MTNKLANRVKVIVSGTPGTGAITLGEAVAGFQSFAAGGISNGDTVPYVVEDGAAWEIGVGTYSSTGPTLTRTSITASSNSGSAINASSNSIVMLSPLAADLQSGTAAGNLVELDSSARIPAVDGSLITNLNVGNAASGTLAVARGGTGLTSLTAGQIPFGNGTSAFGSSSNLVWDSANGRLGLGTSSPATALDVNGVIRGNNTIQLLSSSSYLPQVQSYNSSSDTTGPYWNCYKGRAGLTTSQNGDNIGAFAFNGFDTGNVAVIGAQIQVVQTAAAGSGSVPMAMLFSTNGSERLRIDSSGAVGIGRVPSSGIRLHLGGTLTGNISPTAISSIVTYGSDATGSATSFISAPSTSAASFTVSNLMHFRANAVSLGAGSSLGNQYGFYCSALSEGGTTNYGFFSNIASGTGRWNFYANGTADNYFAGPVQLAAGSASAPSLTAFGDTNTGVFYPAADTVAISTNGSERLRVETSGRILVGASGTTISSSSNVTGGLQIAGAGIAAMNIGRFDNNNVAPGLYFSKSRSSTVGTSSVAVQSGDYTLFMAGDGSDGTVQRRNGGFGLIVDGAPTSGSVPGAWVFLTTASGSTNATERLRITSSGNVGIGTSSPSTRLGFGAYIPSNGQTIHTYQNGNTVSGLGIVLGAHRMFTSTGAVLSFGHVDTEDGSTYFERLRIDSSGRVGIGATPAASSNFVVATNVTGGTTANLTQFQAVVQSDVTSNAYGMRVALSTADAAFSLTNLYHYSVAPSFTIGASSTVGNQYGFAVQSNLTGATNNFGFYSNIAAGTGRWNFYANGTAANYFAGQTFIGTTASYGIGAYSTTNFELQGAGTYTNQVFGNWNSNGASCGIFQFVKSVGGAVGTRGAVTNGTALGVMAFAGDDGTNFIRAANIRAEVDGVPSSDMPGRIIFATTAVGASSSTERLRIDSSGNTAIGASSALSARLRVAGEIRLDAGSGNKAFGFAADGAQFYISEYTQGTSTPISTPLKIIGGASGNSIYIGLSNNIGFGVTSFGTSAAKVIGIANGTAPTTSPANMGQLYVENGALKYRGSSGTVTTIANA